MKIQNTSTAHFILIQYTDELQKNVIESIQDDMNLILNLYKSLYSRINYENNSSNNFKIKVSDHLTNETQIPSSYYLKKTFKLIKIIIY